MDKIAEILQESQARLTAGIVDEIRTTKVTRFGSVNASGKLAASVESRPTPKGYEVVLFGYAYYLVYGRKPGQPPPVDPLKQWAASKGLNTGIAYAIANKISKEGTTIWKQYKGAESGLFQSAISQEAGKIAEELGQYYATTIASDLIIALG